MSVKTCIAFFIGNLLCIILYNLSRNKMPIRILKFRVYLLTNLLIKLMYCYGRLLSDV